MFGMMRISSISLSESFYIIQAASRCCSAVVCCTNNSRRIPVGTSVMQMVEGVLDKQFLKYFSNMYELVKQKSRGQVILFGIIIFTFVTAVLKMAFRESPLSLQKEMIQIANEINSRAPVVMDSTRRFDYVNALENYIFQYNYTLTSYEAKEIDTVFLKQWIRDEMVTEMKSKPESASLSDNGITIQLRYVDKYGKEAFVVSIPPSEYAPN